MSKVIKLPRKLIDQIYDAIGKLIPPGYTAAAATAEQIIKNCGQGDVHKAVEYICREYNVKSLSDLNADDFTKPMWRAFEIMEKMVRS